MFVKNADRELTKTEPGVSRKILAYSDELMMCEIYFEKGAVGSSHSHDHLQITYIAEGKFEFTIDGKSDIVSKGDSVYMPANSVHGVTCLEDGLLIDVFNPMRKDFL